MQSLYDLLFKARYPLSWQMSELERMTLITILEHLKPAVAIEVGAAQGGSLQVLSALAERVYSLDVDPTVPHRLGHFPNVEFRIGDSSETLAVLLRELRAQQRPCPFILIDGDHRTEAVKRDVRALLSVPPLVTTYVLFHDSFNPQCREGIRTADWSAPHAHYVELDFVQGSFYGDETRLPRQMWAGFALAILSPEPRKGALSVWANQEAVFREMYRLSAHWRASTPDAVPALQTGGRISSSS